jgi:hypothetical protein
VVPPEKIEAGMKLPPDYLSRTGYRSLPKLLRAATLHAGGPEARSASYGFRPARTLP